MSTLDSLPSGSRAIVHSVGAVDATMLRLLEMGLTENAVVVVTRRAPLGDPMEIEVRGTRLCLRREHARRFTVK